MAKRAKGLRRTTGPTFIGRSRSVSAEEKAIYHNVAGAGRRRVIRKFFDLGAARIEQARTVLQQLVAKRIGADES